MRRVLLIADLEGIAGVDLLADLVAGSPGYPRACELMTAEINAAVEGLRAAGFDRIRVSDTHLSGSGCSNVMGAHLAPGVELRFEENGYGAALFDGVEAVACVGMHAAAGTGGFGAHTVDPLGIWRCGERLLSEAELVLALAREAGAGCLFISGDDVLSASLADSVPRVVTKRAHGTASARSSDPREARAALRAAPATPRSPPPTPEGDWTITFRTGRQATLAASTGLKRLDRHRVQLEGATLRERIDRGLLGAGVASSVLGGTLPGVPGTPAFTEAAAGLLAGPPVPLELPAGLAEAAARALSVFFEQTRAPDEPSRELRAITLRRLERHAPGVFRRLKLPPTALAGAPADRWSASPSAQPDTHGRVAALTGITRRLLDERGEFATSTLDAERADAIEQVNAAAPWAVASGHLALAAELATCLQAAGESASPTHAMLVHALREAQGPDGASPAREAPLAQTCAAALIALAGAAERA